MKRKFLFLTVLLVVVLAAAGLAYAQSGGYLLPWWSVDGGGGSSTGGNYGLNSGIGQPDASLALSAGNYRLEGGFWSGEVYRYFYLPSVNR